MKTEVKEDERFRFECCAHGIGIGTERDATDEDRYGDSETQCSWECWQAGRAPLLAEIARLNASAWPGESKSSESADEINRLRAVLLAARAARA